MLTMNQEEKLNKRRVQYRVAAQRYLSKDENKEKHLERMRRYYQRNKETILKKAKARYQKKKERLKLMHLMG